MDEGEERGAELVVACCDASELLQFVEEALHVVALAVYSLRTVELLLTVGAVREVGDCALATDAGADMVRVITPCQR